MDQPLSVQLALPESAHDNAFSESGVALHPNAPFPFHLCAKHIDHDTQCASSDDQSVNDVTVTMHCRREPAHLSCEVTDGWRSVQRRHQGRAMGSDAHSSQAEQVCLQDWSVGLHPG